MKDLLRYEISRLWYSKTLLYSFLVCIPATLIGWALIGGRPGVPQAYNTAFEFFIPQLLVFLVPALFIAREQRGGMAKISLLSGKSRIQVFTAKALVYYLAITLTFCFYLALIALMNAGVVSRFKPEPNGFVYFLRYVSVGYAYCIAISSVLLAVAFLFRNPLVSVVSGFGLFVIDFILMSSGMPGRIADIIVPSLLVQQLMTSHPSADAVLSFTLMTVLLTLLGNAAALLVILKKNYK